MWSNFFWYVDVVFLQQKFRSPINIVLPFKASHFGKNVSHLSFCIGRCLVLESPHFIHSLYMNTQFHPAYLTVQVGISDVRSSSWYSKPSLTRRLSLTFFEFSCLPGRMWYPGKWHCESLWYGISPIASMAGFLERSRSSDIWTSRTFFIPGIFWKYISEKRLNFFKLPFNEWISEFLFFLDRKCVLDVSRQRLMVMLSRSKLDSALSKGHTLWPEVSSSPERPSDSSESRRPLVKKNCDWRKELEFLDFGIDVGVGGQVGEVLVGALGASVERRWVWPLGKWAGRSGGKGGVGLILVHSVKISGARTVFIEFISIV